MRKTEQRKISQQHMTVMNAKGLPQKQSCSSPFGFFLIYCNIQSKAIFRWSISRLTLRQKERLHFLGRFLHPS